MGVIGNATGLAGEFHVMELLFRLGHEPALTLGNAKSVDILTCPPSGNPFQVSVKAMRGGGKWGIGNADYSKSSNLIFVLLYYRSFSDPHVLPDVWVIPALKAETIKRHWHNQYAIYLYKKDVDDLLCYKNAWHYLGGP